MTDSKIFVNNPNGSVYYEYVRNSEIIIYPDSTGKFFLNLVVRFHAGRYNEKELKYYEQKLNCKLNNDIQYVEFHLGRFPIETNNVKDLFNKDFFLKDGDQYDDTIAFLYFGHHIETFDNHFSFKEKNSNLFFELKAKSDDFDYYDENAKDSQIEINAEINNIKFIESEEEFNRYELDSDKDEGYYYSILRIWKNQAISEQDNIEISDLEKTDSNIENSKIAWENRHRKFKIISEQKKFSLKNIFFKNKK